MKRLFAVILTAALLVVGGGCKSASSVTFFKAGKADAAVVQTGEGAVLIDTGLKKNGEKLAEALRDMGVTRIEALIVTHFDKDHVGGAAEILRSFAVGAVYQSNHPKDSDEYEAYVEALAEAGLEPVTVTDTVGFRLGGAEFTIDGPARESYEEDPSNNSSLIVTVSCGASTALFAGDAEDARLREFLADFVRPEGTLLLKVPYHGHWQEALPELVAAAEPDIAVISCSKSEPDKDERERTAALLASAGAQVIFTFDGDYTAALG